MYLPTSQYYYDLYSYVIYFDFHIRIIIQSNGLGSDLS